MSLIQTYPNNQNVNITDSSFNDAFGRLRVSNPVTLIDTLFQYGTNPFYWNSVLLSGGTITHLPNDAAVQLTCNTTSGSTVIRQTYQYFRYLPGKSNLIFMTGLLGSKKTNVVQRIGFFDNNNGLFFEQTSSVFKVVTRTSTSGIPVDISVNQSDWNIDRLDGNGVSQIVINTSKTQIFVIDFEWLGVGRVRFGFNIDGITYYCHQFNNANNLTNVYMSTANLPLRYEIKNIDTTSTSTSMNQLCSVIMSEGGETEFRGITHSVSNGITPITVTTRRPILSIRPKSTINSLVNRGLIIPEEFSVYSASDVYYEIVYKGTIGGSPVWTTGSTSSIFEYDISGNSITGGEIIESGYIPSTTGSKINFTKYITNYLPLTLDYNGLNPINLSIAVDSITGSSDVYSSIKIKQVY
jgi:hypothetical protein